MSKIILLDENTRYKIAAGEVIERPVSVVKEMLENSLDAQANKIDIDILDGGVKLIRITDNGEGIHKDDIPLVFERYATSKISTFSDLFSLSSFGFRGEALASISSVSFVELETATIDDKISNTFSIDNHGAHFNKPSPFRQGTCISVSNLFYNIPVRRKFLGSITKEFSLIHDLIVKYSLVFPNVDFALNHQNELIYSTRGYKTTEDIFLKLYGYQLKDKLLILKNIELKKNTYVDAWFFKEDINKNTKKHEVFFINGRLVESNTIEDMLDEAYYTLIPKNRFPIVLLNFKIPSDELDVNIHPNKKKVKIFGDNIWRERFVGILKEELWHSNLEREKRFLYSELEKSDILTSKTEDKINKENNRIFDDRQSNSIESARQIEVINEKNMVSDEDNKIKYSLPQTMNNEVRDSSSLGVLDSLYEIDIKNIRSLKIIGQLNNTFILAENKEALYIIDQHTCHERILYERLMYQQDTKEENYISQILLFPELIYLTPKQEEMLIDNIFQLNTLGFIIEIKDNLICSLSGIPKSLTNINNISSYLQDLLDRLSHYPRVTNADLIEEVLTTKSCKDAVKANWKLSFSDMKYLLEQLSSTNNPHTCPHGRPIIYKITMQELYSIFFRGSYKKT